MKEDIKKGHASIEEYFWWINERQNIWYNKEVLRLPKPWTNDPILQKYKFTNCFRQLDRGTIALNKYILKDWYSIEKPKQTLADMELEEALNILFNIVWYRLFNLDIHAYNLGRVDFKDKQRLEDYMFTRKQANEKCFTSAHMTSGTFMSDNVKCKVYAHLVAANMIASLQDGIYKYGSRMLYLLNKNNTMKAATKLLQELPMVGPFIAYEMVCDLRFTPILGHATDILTWANAGPGAKRGLRRLGLPETNNGMYQLFQISDKYLSDKVKTAPVPFEMREIEHSLCEFDKYQRVKTGAGRPRETYNGSN